LAASLDLYTQAVLQGAFNIANAKGDTKHGTCVDHCPSASP
jgi:hypothetical protein